MTSGLTTRAARFRELNEAGRLLLPNAWDAASARVFEEAGFPAIGTTSAGIAYAEGYQDAERIHRDAMVRAIAKITGAVSIPVTADIEGGYGPSAHDVAATVDAVLTPVPLASISRTPITMAARTRCLASTSSASASPRLAKSPTVAAFRLSSMHARIRSCCSSALTSRSVSPSPSIVARVISERERTWCLCRCSSIPPCSRDLSAACGGRSASWLCRARRQPMISSLPVSCGSASVSWPCWQR
jgi:Phosphoenolpyruvate phosphomutase